VVRKAEDLDEMDLDEEERALALGQIQWGAEHDFPITNTMGMWLNDPKFQTTYHRDYHNALIGLCQELQADPLQGSYLMPGTALNLMFLSVAKHFHWTWGMGSLAAVEPGVDGFDAEHVFMLDFPESEVWTDEQRLALVFTKAVLTLSVTDELMASAIETWGVKLTIRHLGMIGSLTSQALFMSAFNVTGRWNDAPGSEIAMVKATNTAMRSPAREDSEA
jgi:hypothetical protein